MNRVYNIGIFSDSPHFVTGYATQAQNIGNILADRGHNVIYFGHGYVGQDIMPGTKFEDGHSHKFRVVGGGREAYMKDVLSIYMKKYKIDALIILLDTFMLFPWIINYDFSPAKLVFYFPSDGGGGLPLQCENILKRCDLSLAMAKFGKKQVEDMYKIPCKHIPHGVNTQTYYPLPKEEKEQLKARMGLSGKFVVGSVFRNQGRKMPDRELKAFALFAKNNPDAILFLHTDPDDAAAVFHMPSLIAKYNLQNKIIFTGMKFYNGFTYKQMNEVYNVMDVFFLTTSGEGFGIPTIEAMACGVPVLVTDYTSTREIALYTNAGMVIDLVGTEFEENPDAHENEILDGTIMGSWNVERAICSLKDANAKLQFLKDNPKVREEFGKNGRKACLEIYDWKVVGPQFIETIEEVAGRH